MGSFDLKPKRLSNESRREIQEIFGYSMCPFTAFQQKRGPKELSADGDDIVCVYICGNTLGPAKYGQYVRLRQFEGAMTPCPTACAIGCLDARIN